MTSRNEWVEEVKRGGLRATTRALLAILTALALILIVAWASSPHQSASMRQASTYLCQ